MELLRSYSWGNLPKVRQRVVGVHWRDEPLPDGDASLLPFGLGRSYGDSCLNDGNSVLLTRALDRILSFDRTTGVLRCEAGLSLAAILDLVVPHGWFLPVTPGTKFVTVGGAIANDVHGKNHETAGSFGNHIRSIELLRSDAGRIACSRDENKELFSATIGGLGLTGLILSAELSLKPISSDQMVGETIKFRDLDEFAALCNESRSRYEYTVAWVDCVSKGRALGRGLFSRASHADEPTRPPQRKRRLPLRVPIFLPNWLLNTGTIRAFNIAYYHRQTSGRQAFNVHYESFLYPLDALANWNRIYGRRGFFQYQCVVPGTDYATVKRLIGMIGASGAGSFLVVLKEFGPRSPLGMLSFPREGVTLALDFPNNGARTLELLDRLDEVVSASGGAVYPAKDARMSSRAFATYFPRWGEFRDYIDPRFSSSFWRRVTG